VSWHGNVLARPEGNATNNNHEEHDMKQPTNAVQDVLDCLEGDEHLELDPRACHFPDHGLVPAQLRGKFYGIGGFDIVQGLDLLWG